MTNKTKQIKKTEKREINKVTSTYRDTEVVETIEDEDGAILATAEIRKRFDCLPHMLFFVSEGEQRELIGGTEKRNNSLKQLKQAYKEFQNRNKVDL